MAIWINGEKMDTTWGRYIKQTYGNDAYKAYQKRYQEFYRYSRRVNPHIKVSKEAGLSIIRDYSNAKAQTIQTQIMREMKNKKVSELGSIEAHIRLARMADKFTKAQDLKIYEDNDMLKGDTKPIYNLHDGGGAYRTVSMNIQDIIDLYDAGKITLKELNALIKLYKATPEYITSGSK